MSKWRHLGAAAFAVLVFSWAGNASAAFPEKDITFIIPYGPGGGFDTYVRRIAPVMQRYLPSKVNVLPKNVAGAGGRKAAADLYRAKPDGYQIAIFNMPGMLLDKVLGKKTNFDVEKFTWIGRLGQSRYVLAVAGKSGIASVKDLMGGKRLKYAITDWSSTSYVAGKIMAEAMGMKVTFLPGYKSSADISLSLVRGDTQISLFNTASFDKWMKGGDLKPVMSFEKKSLWPGVPTVAEAGFPELEALTIDRVVGGPPKMKPEVVKVLSDAIIKALNDPEILAWAKKTKSEIDPLSGPETAKVLADSAKFYTKYKAALASH